MRWKIYHIICNHCFIQGQLCDLRLWFWPRGKTIGIRRINEHQWESLRIDVIGVIIGHVCHLDVEHWRSKNFMWFSAMLGDSPTILKPFCNDSWVFYSDLWTILKWFSTDSLWSSSYSRWFPNYSRSILRDSLMILFVDCDSYESSWTLTRKICTICEDAWGLRMRICTAMYSWFVWIADSINLWLTLYFNGYLRSTSTWYFVLTYVLQIIRTKYNTIIFIIDLIIILIMQQIQNLI